MNASKIPGPNLALEAVRVTEAAARAAARFTGLGNERAAEEAAVADMQDALETLDIQGRVRVGPGGEDPDAPLHVGAAVGSERGPSVDVALMPLEGATIAARGATNALSLIAIAEHGGFLHVPDLYMDKIAIGCCAPKDLLDLDAEPADNLKALADYRKTGVGDLAVCILDRPRHRDLIAKVREAGARIVLISDGDVSGAIATTVPGTGVDIYMGIGGAPQGVPTAAALCCSGGHMQARLVIRNEEDRRRARECGIEDLDRKYSSHEMAMGEITFAATGVTDGSLLAGVRTRTHHGSAKTQSLVMRSETGTLRYVEALHNFSRRD